MNALHQLFQGLMFAHGHFATPEALRSAGLLEPAPVPGAEPDTRVASAQRDLPGAALTC